jgi:hypothetical protein
MARPAAAPMVCVGGRLQTRSAPRDFPALAPLASARPAGPALLTVHGPSSPGGALSLFQLSLSAHLHRTRSKIHALIAAIEHAQMNSSAL